MNLRRADCGHYVPADLAPAGVHVGNEQPVYLCNECAERARSHVAKVETKLSDVQFTAKLRGPLLVPELSAHEHGRQAAEDGTPEDHMPYPDRRTKDAKEWLRGYREVKSGTAAEDPGRDREAPA